MTFIDMNIDEERNTQFQLKKMRKQLEAAET